MAQVTARGRFIATKLNPYMGTTRQIQEACSLIGRHAMTYSHIQELWCVPNYYEAKEARLEARITDLVESLPHTDNGPVRVEFTGDPRGSTVKLTLPDGTVIAADEMQSFINRNSK